MILNRNIVVLTVAQMFTMCGSTLTILIGGLIGKELAPEGWATLPVALVIIGAAICVIPAVHFMKHFSRKSGFLLANILGMFGSGLAILALLNSSFLLFCLASLVIGSGMAFLTHYRFAAMESVLPEQAAKAVATLLLGSLVAAILGPELAESAYDWGLSGYTGSFLGLAFVFMAAFLVLFLFKHNHKPIQLQQNNLDARSLSKLFRQPKMQMAVLASATGFAVMALVMTATPIQLHKIEGYTLSDAKLVIQSHMIGMFLPSLFSGWIISRVGIYKVLLAGIFAMLTCVFFAVTATAYHDYWIALIMLGIGWNFLYVGGTSLLPQCYQENEKFKVQAANDFIILSLQALASLLAGFLLYQLGWVALNIVCLPLLVFLGFIIFRGWHADKQTLTEQAMQE